MIWQECATFQTTRQGLGEQVRTIIEKGLFSDLEILEIHQKINDKRVCNTISDTPSIDKREPSNRNEQPPSKNRNASKPNSTKQTQSNTK